MLWAKRPLSSSESARAATRAHLPSRRAPKPAPATFSIGGCSAKRPTQILPGPYDQKPDQGRDADDDGGQREHLAEHALALVASRGSTQVRPSTGTSAPRVGVPGRSRRPPLWRGVLEQVTANRPTNHRRHVRPARLARCSSCSGSARAAAASAALSLTFTRHFTAPRSQTVVSCGLPTEPVPWQRLALDCRASCRRSVRCSCAAVGCPWVRF